MDIKQLKTLPNLNWKDWGDKHKKPITPLITEFAKRRNIKVKDLKMTELQDVGEIVGLPVFNIIAR